MSEQTETTEQAESEQIAEASANVDSAPRESAPAAQVEKSEARVRGYQRLVIRLIVIVAIIWVLLFQIVGITHMPNDDMYPRLDAGDLVVFYRLDTDVSAQDVIVIEKVTPHSNGAKQMFISRVVAKEGDTVDFANDHVIVNGNALVEANIFYPTPAYEGSVSYPLTLGPGECFVLADKRNEGADSRFFGPVQKEEIKGSVITIVRRNKL